MPLLGVAQSVYHAGHEVAHLADRNGGPARWQLATARSSLCTIIPLAAKQKTYEKPKQVEESTTLRRCEGLARAFLVSTVLPGPRL